MLKLTEDEIECLKKNIKIDAAQEMFTGFWTTAWVEALLNDKFDYASTELERLNKEVDHLGAPTNHLNKKIAKRFVELLTYFIGMISTFGDPDSIAQSVRSGLEYLNIKYIIYTPGKSDLIIYAHFKGFDIGILNFIACQLEKEFNLNKIRFSSALAEHDPEIVKAINKKWKKLRKNLRGGDPIDVATKTPTNTPIDVECSILSF